MTVEQIRLDNLRLLVRERGTIAAVAEAASTPPSYLSQVLTRARSRTGKPRDIGSQLARKLETGCGKPEGWMDVRHDDIAVEDSAFIHEIKKELASREVPEHLRETILLMLHSAPKKGGPETANDEENGGNEPRRRPVG